jgi:hypothetical protein
VKEFAALHGGSVRVGKSSLGGAEFVVSFPVKQTQAEVPSMSHDPTPLPLVTSAPSVSLPTAVPEESAKMIQAAALQTLVDLRGQITHSTSACPAVGSPSEGTVLIVEDNADMRSFIVDNLSAHFLVISAVNGQDALTKVRKSHE